MTDDSPLKDNKVQKIPHKKVFSTWLSKFVGMQKSQTIEEAHLDDLRADLASALDQGVLDLEAVQMFEGILAVSNATVRDIMISRARVVMLNTHQSLNEILAVINESGHSRFPVLGDDQEEVLGILLAKDLLKFFNQPDIDINSLLRKPYFVPEGKSVSALLKDFQSSCSHLALVIDEYGSFSGIVTIEDVLEEIVGEIEDEHDTKQEILIHRLGENHYLLDAMLEIEAFNSYFGTSFEDEEVDTIGGVIMMQLGRLPKIDEVIAFNGLSFKILPFDGKRLGQIEVTRQDSVS